MKRIVIHIKLLSRPIQVSGDYQERPSGQLVEKSPLIEPRTLILVANLKVSRISSSVIC